MSSNQSKIVIKAEKAPKAIGPYSVGIQLGNLVAGGIEAETRQTLTNLKHILEAAGSGLDKVVKTTVFLRDINEFGRMNPVYGEFFTENPPARTTVQAAALPRGGAIEIDIIAYVD